MPGTQAIYYRDRRGRRPVEEFIDGLPPKHQAAVDLAIDRLNGLLPNEPPLAFPATSQVDGELRELRCHYGPVLYRVLYRRSKNLFVLLHIVAQKHRKPPRIGHRDRPDAMGRLQGPDGCAATAASACSRR